MGNLMKDGQTRSSIIYFNNKRNNKMFKKIIGIKIKEETPIEKYNKTQLRNYISANMKDNFTWSEEAFERYATGIYYGYYLISIFVGKKLKKSSKNLDCDTVIWNADLDFIYHSTISSYAEKHGGCCMGHLLENRPSRKLLKSKSFLKGVTKSFKELPKIYSKWFEINDLSVEVAETTKERIDEICSVLSYEKDPKFKDFLCDLKSYFPSKKPSKPPLDFIGKFKQDNAYELNKIKYYLKEENKNTPVSQGFFLAKFLYDYNLQKIVDASPKKNYGIERIDFLFPDNHVPFGLIYNPDRIKGKDMADGFAEFFQKLVPLLYMRFSTYRNHSHNKNEDDFVWPTMGSILDSLHNTFDGYKYMEFVLAVLRLMRK